MTQLTPHSSDDEPERSPFDPLRHFDERGEYWWASEICEPLGYTWRRFPDVIERARLALQANGDDPDVHIVPKTGLSTDALGNPGREWRLTRYGAYTVVQGGDPIEFRQLAQDENREALAAIEEDRAFLIRLIRQHVGNGGL